MIQLRAIPAVGGPSLPGLSYIAAVRGQFNFKKVVEEGYRKACPRPSSYSSSIGSPPCSLSLIVSGIDVQGRPAGELDRRRLRAAHG